MSRADDVVSGLEQATAEVEADEVTVLVNAAELGSSINADAAAKELEAATTAAAPFEGQPPSTEKVKAQQELARAQAERARLESRAASALDQAAARIERLAAEAA